MTTLIDRALEREGLLPILARRLAGPLDAHDVATLDARIPTLDILLVGAMADRVRAHDRGDVVELHLDAPRDEQGDDVFTIGRENKAISGQALSRLVARARLCGTPARTIRMDVVSLGITRAQLGLAFGADALVAPLDALGFAVFDDEAETDGKRSVADLLRERELATLIVGAKRIPRVVEWPAAGRAVREVDTTTEARRQFRAPGREEAELRARREKLISLGKSGANEATSRLTGNEGDAR